METKLSSAGPAQFEGIQLQKVLAWNLQPVKGRAVVELKMTLEQKLGCLLVDWLQALPYLVLDCVFVSGESVYWLHYVPGMPSSIQ